MAWRLGGMIVGLGGVMIGALVGLAYEPVGVFVMLISAAGAFVMFGIGGRTRPMYRRKDDD